MFRINLSVQCPEQHSTSQAVTMDSVQRSEPKSSQCVPLRYFSVSGTAFNDRHAFLPGQRMENFARTAWLILSRREQLFTARCGCMKRNYCIRNTNVRVCLRREVAEIIFKPYVEAESTSGKSGGIKHNCNFTKFGFSVTIQDGRSGGRILVGGEIFHIRPDRSWGTHRLLYVGRSSCKVS